MKFLKHNGLKDNKKAVCVKKENFKKDYVDLYFF
jgi:hypothetical protein